jgi:hypothetical protein
MTEEENPRNPKPGIFLLLGKRKRRASHIPTAPAAATLFQNLIPKGAFLRHSPNLSFRLILRLEKTERGTQLVVVSTDQKSRGTRQLTIKFDDKKGVDVRIEPTTDGLTIRKTS